ncbi:hypothetical protein [Parafrankia sp. CH37]|uniref:hypothetical protein n=1 Tax=Parafrankia sp. CH37 TaxID=683308 RepID=UPI001D0276C3|nr:hypothetical protein [Parafrankia sp. CH37]
MRLSKPGRHTQGCPHGRPPVPGVDRAWEEVGPHLLHDAVSYASWNEADQRTDTTTTSLSFATTVDELRAENRSHRVMTVEEAVELARGGQTINLHPLVGGLPPRSRGVTCGSSSTG